MAQNPPSTVGSSLLQVILYWAIVAVPLGWGVYKTVNKSIPLFTGVSAVAATPAPAQKESTPPPLATAGPAENAAPTATVAPAAPVDALVPAPAATPTP